MTENLQSSGGVPMDWIRGLQIGRGSSATVNLAIPRPIGGSGSVPRLMVVKSCDVAAADCLRNERDILRQLDGGCPQIIRFFGDSSTVEDGSRLYNLFFEYANGGSLFDHVSRLPGKRLPESDVRRHTGSILRGLSFIHDSGIVHCDIKLDNILMFDDGEVKISDFGLSKEKKDGEEKKNRGFELRGTPLYMAPEVVAGDEVDSPADVWALGCAVVEMATGKSAWKCEPGCGVPELLCRIGAGNQTPEIPQSLSEEGQDFLTKCFEKDPNERWTTRMLSGHPFVSGLGIETTPFFSHEKPSASTSSPTGPFDFPEWTPTEEDFPSPGSASEFINWDDWLEAAAPISASALMRVEKLAGCPPVWSDSDSEDWITVR